MCAVGRNALILHEFVGRDVPITGYDCKSTIDHKLVSVAVGYRDPQTGQIWILSIHQAVSVPSIENNLLCPMQMRIAGVHVNECPKFLCTQPDHRLHALVIPSKYGDYVIPCSLNGVTSYFPTFKPTTSDYELAENEGRLLELTAEEPKWNPQNPLFSEMEASTIDHNGKVVEAAV